jgi:hypothetical protein
MKMRALLPMMVATASLLSACDGEKATSVLAPSAPSLITSGSLDGAGHPAVILIIMDIAGAPAYRCSGTLISPKRVLTAGHCVGEVGEFSGVRIFTESDVQNGDNNYPFAGPNTIEATSWAAHPLFTEAQFSLHDVGIIALSTPVRLSASAYGRLPALNQLDALKPASTTTFTSVGYGLQESGPKKFVSQKIRMVAEPHLLQINTGFTGSFSLLLSNNTSTGGTCFGDSGGPNFLGSSNVVAGVTSYGLNGSCGGTGGVFRVDRKDVQDFLAPYLEK